MSGKHKKIFSKKDKLRVRKSYYTFTREYPKYIEVETTGRRITPKTVRKAIIYCIVFLIISSVSFFGVKLAINISYAPIDETLQSQQQTDLNDKILSQGLKALYMPYEKMGDEEYIRDLIKEIKKKNANSVVIDFKTSDGRLCYTSLNENAIAASAALYDNDTARNTVSQFSQAGIAVAGRIFCFSDNRLAQANGDVAVKYMGTEVNWLDGNGESGGKAWLNPYSKSVREYIASVAKEVSSLGVGILILEDLQFPSSENTSSATYPGERDMQRRNAVLKNTIAKVKNSLPEKSLLIVSQSAADASQGNEKAFYGTLGDVECYGVAVDTAERPSDIVIDKKTDYISVLSMYSSIEGRFTGKKVIPIVNTDEYSRSYFRAMKKSGIESFILFSENGEY